MYKITRISAAEIEHGKQLERNEALEYIREHTEVLGEFDSYLDAREFWQALGLPVNANYCATGGVIYKLRRGRGKEDVARTY